LKFVGFWEFNFEDLDKIMKKSQQSNSQRDERLNRYPQIILGPFLLGGEAKGLTVYEVEDPKQLMNVSLHYAPEIRFRFVPIFETEIIAELIARDACTNDNQSIPCVNRDRYGIISGQGA
jgi:hypothetical protein